MPIKPAAPVTNTLFEVLGSMFKVYLLKNNVLSSMFNVLCLKLAKAKNCSMLNIEP